MLIVIFEVCHALLTERVVSQSMLAMNLQLLLRIKLVLQFAQSTGDSTDICAMALIADICAMALIALVPMRVFVVRWSWFSGCPQSCPSWH